MLLSLDPQAILENTLTNVTSDGLQNVVKVTCGTFGLNVPYFNFTLMAHYWQN